MNSQRSRSIFQCYPLLFTILFLGVSSHGAVLTEGASTIVRQLDEWRKQGAFWVQEASQAPQYKTNTAALIQLKVHYVNLSAIANSIIGRLALEAIDGQRIKVKSYVADLERAKVASVSLTAEGKRLLDALPPYKLSGMPNSRGPSPTAEAYSKFVADNAQKTIGLADGLFKILDTRAKAFAETKAKDRDGVVKELKGREWADLNELVK